MDFQLQRLVLIDSYSAGRVVEFRLDGGAVLTGRNGRGKTTLLQLIPIFYGENPTRIVGTETNRLDFNGYYLPRLTSYIIFEYRRRDQTCLVVLHANEQGGERRYRFVRSAYRPELFLLPDGVNILQSPDLPRHLKLMQVDRSAAISSISEYRSIVQGKAGSGKQGVKQRALVADYAFVGSGQHLTHIEKIVSGMFLRRTDFQDLQRMVVSCIAEGDGEIALRAERGKIAAWPAHYAAYASAMEQRGHMDEALEHEAQLVALEAELGRIHARVLRLQDHLTEANRTNRRERAEQTGLTQQETQQHDQTALQIQMRMEGAGREAKDQEQRTQALDRQQEAYLDNDLPGKAERLKCEPDLRQQLAELQQRQEALLGEQGKISLKYERLLNEQGKRFNRETEEAQKRRTALFDSYEPRLGAVEEQARTDRDQLSHSHRSERQAIDDQLKHCIGQCGEWRQKAEHPQPEPSLVDVHTAKAAQVETLEEQQQTAERAARSHKDAVEQAKHAFGEQETKLAGLNEQAERLALRRQQRLLQQSPGEHSLLHFLRTRRPDWVFDIAKVVREDLLLRTDLEPELLEPLQSALSFYGVGLDLAPLEAHLAADEGALRGEIAAIDAQLTKLDSQREQAHKDLEQCDKARRKAESDRGIAEAEVQRIGTQLNSAGAEKKSAAQEVEQSRKHAQRQAHDQLDKLEQERKTLEKALRDLDQGHQQALEARDQRRADERRDLEQARDTELQAHDRQQDQRGQDHAKNLVDIMAERDGALSKAGVDTDALKQLERAIDGVAEQLRQIEQSRNEVNAWQLWKQQEWPRRSDYERTARQQREFEAAARQELDAEHRRWKLRSGQLQQGLDRLDRQHSGYEQQLDAISKRLDLFRAYPADDAVMAGNFDAGWTLDALSEQANTCRQQADALVRDIGKRIEQIKRAFSDRRGAPPDQFFESHRTELGPDAPPRLWLPVFKAWFDSEHDAYRRTLAVDAHQIAGAVVAFHRDMDSFHRRVQQFNRELQQSLDDNLGFESVSRVTIEIKSMIRELEYWRPIEAMAEEQRGWLQLEGQALPPPEFADTLRALLEHWEVREGIRATRQSLIRIQGEVVENGQTRTFRKAADLERVSSNGLSYLILCVIFIAFINRIRRQASVQIVWALDELKDLDIGNIEALLDILRRNHITLVSAFPDPDADVLALFRHRYSIEEGRRLLEVRLSAKESADEESIDEGADGSRADTAAPVATEPETTARPDSMPNSIDHPRAQPEADPAVGPVVTMISSPADLDV